MVITPPVTIFAAVRWAPGYFIAPFAFKLVLLILKVPWRIMDSACVRTSISRSLELTAKSKSGLETLAYLFSNYAITTAMMRTFSAKISSLEYFLQNVQGLLEKLRLHPAEDLAPIEDVIQNLEGRLETCQRDIEKWIEKVTNMNLDSGRILAGFMKTARIALLTDDFVQIGQQATDHQHGMAADLQILFR